MVGTVCCKVNRAGVHLMAILAGLNLAAGLGTGNILLLASGLFSGVDLGTIYIILSAGKVRANMIKIAPACGVAVAFGAGAMIMITSAVRLTSELTGSAGWVSLVSTLLLAICTGAAGRILSSLWRGSAGLEKALLERSCRFGFYRLLLVSAALLLSHLWHPAVALLAAQGVGVAIMQLGLEVNWAGIENPHNLHRGSRLRAVIKQHILQAAGRARISRVEMEGSVVDLCITVDLDESPALHDKQRLEENIRAELARNFKEINRLQVAVIPVPAQDMV
ncbi:MAG TPA: hypothetical protein GX693_06350 [Firmicutes bacterium]|nr:hypothetical protein [Bacillota bacterium]